MNDCLFFVIFVLAVVVGTIIVQAIVYLTRNTEDDSSTL